MKQVAAREIPFMTACILSDWYVTSKKQKLSLLARRDLLQVRSVSTVIDRSVDSDPYLVLLGVHVRRDPFVDITVRRDRVRLLRFVRRVEVVNGRRVVHPVQGYRATEVGRVHVRRDALVVIALADGVVALGGGRRVEVIRARRRVQSVERYGVLDLRGEDLGGVALGHVGVVHDRLFHLRRVRRVEVVRRPRAVAAEEGHGRGPARLFLAILWTTGSEEEHEVGRAASGYLNTCGGGHGLSLQRSKGRENDCGDELHGGWKWMGCSSASALLRIFELYVLLYSFSVGMSYLNDRCLRLPSPLEARER